MVNPLNWCGRRGRKYPPGLTRARSGSLSSRLAATITIHGYLRWLGLDMSQELEQGLNIKRRASIGYGQSERLGA